MGWIFLLAFSSYTKKITKNLFTFLVLELDTLTFINNLFKK